MTSHQKVFYTIIMSSACNEICHMPKKINLDRLTELAYRANLFKITILTYIFYVIFVACFFVYIKKKNSKCNLLII